MAWSSSSCPVSSPSRTIIRRSSAIAADSTHGPSGHNRAGALHMVRRPSRPQRRVPARGAAGRAPRDLLPPRAHGPVGDPGTSLGGRAAPRAARPGGLAHPLRALRRAARGGSPGARPPPRRAPDPGRVLLGRAPLGMGEGGRALALIPAEAAGPIVADRAGEVMLGLAITVALVCIAATLIPLARGAGSA